ncbi:hypothetical protein K505DRAFT_367625 [Melanomma pulvis-pyrius CBS 109.77]|uniref:Uncharacterized protein n=1 Tax=Melanomma pulvis-pyrius CBS 109.77 TaxID=1314802 RepID=A0A6A6WTJ4_9PLEO|nr:hypothetical protein K505DRAFT_367625 [Melanomma pulvis-pyrius CBS 109.77]
MPFLSLFDPVLDRVIANKPNLREPNLFDETIFALKVTFKNVPGMFTRENRSNVFVDLFWAGVLFLISLVYAGARLQELRSTLTITVKGYDPRFQADFNQVDANLLGAWLSDHPDGANKAIDGANSIIHFLAYIVDPLPDFISQPSTTTLHIAKVAILYSAYRFLVLHRHWRFNFLLPHVSYAVLSLALWWVYSVDPWLALFAACFWCFPTIIAFTVLLHELLGDNAWKTQNTLNYTYIKEDLWRDLEKKLYSPKPASPTWSSTSYKSQFVGRGRTYTLLDEEDSEGEQEAQEGAFTRLLELNLPEGDRRQRNRTPCSTPVLS